MHSRTVLAFAVLALAASRALPAQTPPYDFAAARQFSELRNGNALLVAIDGRIVFERYANGWTATRAHRLASGTKSFNGVIAALAARDGLLRYNELVADTITEWRTDPRKSRITYRQLLSLQSGLWGGTSGMQVSYAQSIGYRTVGAPGAVFNYGPIPFQVFGEAMKRKLASSNRSVADYIQAELLTPLGMTVGAWTDWTIGEPRLPGGAQLAAREWLKFGEFVRRGGVVNGRRIVAKALLDALFVGTQLKPEYGMSWWLPMPNSSEPDDAVTAQGAGKQRLYVIGSHDMVIVRFGETMGGWSDERFLEALMPAGFARFGIGCRGSNGIPTLEGNPAQRPVLGSRFGVRGSNLPSARPSVLYVGGSNREYLGTPLPIDLSVIGMPRCALLASPDVSIGFSSGAGQVTRTFPVPNVPQLASYSVFLQTVHLDPGANPLGVTVSNGLTARIGAR